MMKQKALGQSGIMVTPAGMGVMKIGRTQLGLPLADGADVVGYALDRGINFLDTAEWYQTYDYIAEALRTRRTKTDFTMPVIASKSLSSSFEGMSNAIDDMRRALDMDTIDIFLLHEVREAPDFERREGAWACLNEMKAKGIVRAVGISTHYVDVAEMNADLADSDVLFPLINKDSLGIRDGKGFGTAENMARAIRRNHEASKGVFAMKVFGGGNLTGQYIECLDYVNGLTGVDSIMIGMSEREEVDTAIAYFDGALDRSYTPDTSKKKIRIDAGDCECCGACLDICPNKAIAMSAKGAAEVDHNICLTCGYCAPACPVRAIIMY